MEGDVDVAKKIIQPPSATSAPQVDSDSSPGIHSNIREFIRRPLSSPRGLFQEQYR